jgi:hypothetical protein
MREINSRANTTFGKTPYGVLLEKSVTTLRRAEKYPAFRNSVSPISILELAKGFEPPTL